MSKLTTNKTELIKPNLWANKLYNEPIKKVPDLPKNSEEDEMSTLTSLAVTTCLYSIKIISLIFPICLSLLPFLHKQPKRTTTERKNKQLRDRHHPPQKKPKWGSSSSHSKINSPLVCSCSLCFWSFLFPRKRNVRRSWSVFASFLFVGWCRGEIEGVEQHHCQISR